MLPFFSIIRYSAVLYSFWLTEGKFDKGIFDLNCNYRTGKEGWNSNCFSKNLWRNKRTTILFYLNTYVFEMAGLFLHLQYATSVKWHCQNDTSNSFFSFLWNFKYHNIILLSTILIFSEYERLVPILTHPKSGKETLYWINCLLHSDTIYHLIDSEYGSQSYCSICDRRWLDFY